MLPQEKYLTHGKIFFLGRMMGFEPTASGATIQRSNLLSYIRHSVLLVVLYQNFAQIPIRFMVYCLKHAGVV